MVQSPSWEANWFAASQEIPCISRNPKVHYRTHKRPPPVSILGQPNPVHIPTSWRSILILSTHLRLGLPSGLLPSGVPSNTLYTPLSSPICTTYPAHLIVQASACNTDATPTQPHWNSNTHRTKNNKTNLVIQQNSCKLLMMDILMSETCWAHKKWNKIASDIKLVFYSSTITIPLVHGPINIRYFIQLGL